MKFLNAMNFKLLAIFWCFVITTQPIDSFATQQKECRDIPIAQNKPSIKSKSGEIKAIDMIWNADGAPFEDARPAIQKIEDLGFAYFSSFDLNNDGQDEIFIRSSGRSGSGGAAFIILEKQNGKWIEIASFLGGFVLNNGSYPRYDNRYYSITLWTRVGGEETYQTVLAYKNHKYQGVSSQLVPYTILYSKDFQKFILDNNWMCWKNWN